MLPSEEVVMFAGGAQMASLNLFDSGGGCMIAAQQVDDSVYVVGQDSFAVAKSTLDGWLNEVDQPDPPIIDCFDAEGAWEMLRNLRLGCFVWQCGGCEAWMFTSNRPWIGILRCSTCGEGGVYFRHADRHVGGDQ
ncbi:hypothetical protein [Janibacter indicus]|uniref:hypothetical protein n=1 Tax=Janibacter indicus TaxID=857417 RepID=UPI003EB98CF9